MKRHLVFGTVLAALIGVTTPSWALDVKWGGDYRLRGFYTDNLTDADKNTLDSASYLSSRFLLTVAATEENVSGVVTLAAGSTNGTGNRLLGASSFGPDGSAVALLEAYIKADFKTWAFKGGRSVYKLGNGIILDDAVDGLWADFGLGGIALTVANLKLGERTDTNAGSGANVGIGNVPGAGTAGDTDLYVVNAGFGKMAMGPAHDLNVFLAYLNDRSAALITGAAAADDVTAVIFGVSANADVGGVKLKGEFDYLNGTHKRPASTDMDIKGMNLVLGAKLNAGAVPLGVDLIYVAGLDPADAATDHNLSGLSGNYPVGIIITNIGARSLAPKDGSCLSFGGSAPAFGGPPNCVDGKGLMAVKVSSGMTHGPHTVDVAAIYAQSAEDSATVNGSTDIGIELDATLTWALTKRLSALGGVGYLMSGDYFKAGTSTATDNQTVMVAQLSYTF